MIYTIKFVNVMFGALFKKLRPLTGRVHAPVLYGSYAHGTKGGVMVRTLDS